MWVVGADGLPAADVVGVCVGGCEACVCCAVGAGCVLVGDRAFVVGDGEGFPSRWCGAGRGDVGVVHGFEAVGDDDLFDAGSAAFAGQVVVARGRVAACGVGGHVMGPILDGSPGVHARVGVGFVPSA